jgi:pimeloyl-ACP methyl ester carboxylesterase
MVDQLRSVGTDPASLGDLTADANHVRAVLDSLDEPVVLVGHSYGGMVITELADHPRSVTASTWRPSGRSEGSPCWI